MLLIADYAHHVCFGLGQKGRKYTRTGLGHSETALSLEYLLLSSVLKASGNMRRVVGYNGCYFVLFDFKGSGKIRTVPQKE